MGVLQQIWLSEIIGGYVTYVSKYHNVGIWDMD